MTARRVWMVGVGLQLLFVGNGLCQLGMIVLLFAQSVTWFWILLGVGTALLLLGQVLCCWGPNGPGRCLAFAMIAADAGVAALELLDPAAFNAEPLHIRLLVYMLPAFVLVAFILNLTAACRRVSPGEGRTVLILLGLALVCAPLAFLSHHYKWPQQFPGAWMLYADIGVLFAAVICFLTAIEKAGDMAERVSDRLHRLGR